MNIQWYPGHMAKTRRIITENLKNVDVVCEVVDARIPQASRNPDIDALAGAKPRLMILNRVDQADPAATKRWTAYFASLRYAVIETDGKKGTGVAKFVPAVRGLMKEKIQRQAQRGMLTQQVKAMIVGIPNVGKSTIINKLAGKRAAQAQDRPGVTRAKQWFFVGDGLDLMDTPGILWPKLDDEHTGLCLAFTGAIRDEIMDTETLGCKLMETLAVRAKGALEARYGITEEKIEQANASQWPGYELLKAAGRRRGFLVSGGEIDTERMAKILLDEFRAAKLGRITLEMPPSSGEGSDA